MFCFKCCPSRMHVQREIVPNPLPRNVSDNSRNALDQRVVKQGQAALGAGAGPLPAVYVDNTEEKKEYKHEVVGSASAAKAGSVDDLFRVSSNPHLSPAMKFRVDQLLEQKRKEIYGGEMCPNRPNFDDVKIFYNFRLSSLADAKIQKLGKKLETPQRVLPEQVKENCKLIDKDAVYVLTIRGTNDLQCYSHELDGVSLLRRVEGHGFEGNPYQAKSFIHVEAILEMLVRDPASANDPAAYQRAIAVAEAEERSFMAQMEHEIIQQVIAEEEAYFARQPQQGLRHRISHAAAGAGAGPGPGNSMALIAL